MRVLGVDPGLTRCGVGVVEGSIGRPLHLVEVGVVRTGADLPIDQRLCLIEEGSRSGSTAPGPTPSPSSGSSASTTCAR